MLVSAMALFLVIVLASPLQTYLSRRGGVAASQRQNAELQQRVLQLQQQSDAWNDPSYVERQARARLQYIRPGDTLYTILNADGTPRASSDTGPVALPRLQHQASWNATLWGSVADADATK
ncbi:MAG: acyl-phosphate glycerol 3-phosphate acyltransferase [Frankiales bacterium]|nr:acyl-phosphate glycerol 3-phosphate acyltransferase [Frankiales bacterium]